MKREIVLQHLTDPEFFQENRLAPVSDHFWYETEAEALAGVDMRLSMSLSGTWSFLYVPNPESVPEGLCRKILNSQDFPAWGGTRSRCRPTWSCPDMVILSIRIRTIHGMGGRLLRLIRSRGNRILPVVM